MISDTEATGRAAAWVQGVYHGRVELAVPEPVVETGEAWLYSCRALPEPGYPATPMLNATVAVPKTGAPAFHPAN